MSKAKLKQLYLRIRKKQQRGITLLLVILVMSGLMTVSIGIFNVSFNELRISGELTSSFRAFYAADRLFEYALKEDRDRSSLCAADSPDAETPCYTICTSDMPGCPLAGPTVEIISRFVGPDESTSVGCAKVTLIRPAGGLTAVRAVGQFDCTENSLRVVRRAFEVSY